MLDKNTLKELLNKGLLPITSVNILSQMGYVFKCHDGRVIEVEVEQ